MHRVNWHSIRFRLTASYAAIFAITFLCVAIFVWLTLARSITATVDKQLRARLATVRGYVEQEATGPGAAHMSEELSEDAVVNEGSAYLRIEDRRGVLIYCSPNARAWPSRLSDGARLPSAGIIRSVSIEGNPFRILSAPVSIGSVQIGLPLDEFREMQQAFFWSICLFTPALLLAAAAAGYWMSGRALRPVEGIASTAQLITSANLSDRLSRSGAGDELDRLSEVLNEMLARLESAFRRITQFTGDASHELRTPLAIMRTTAELILSRARTPEEHERAWKSVLTQIERTTDLVDDLLILARADSGAERLTLQAADVACVAAAAVSEMEVLASAKGVQLRFLANTHPLVLLDEAALRRLFTILLDNALKATAPGDFIEISIEQADELESRSAVIAITDSGAGISPEDLPHIFDRFYRASKDRSRASGGAGLGLAIAHWIASEHRGVIEVESQLERGTTFRVTLPLAAETQASFSNSSESPVTLRT